MPSRSGSNRSEFCCWIMLLSFWTVGWVRDTVRITYSTRYLALLSVFLLGDSLILVLTWWTGTGNEEKLMLLLMLLNVNCHASDGGSPTTFTWQPVTTVPGSSSSSSKVWY
jgi:hypothetical protein